MGMLSRLEVLSWTVMSSSLAEHHRVEQGNKDYVGVKNSNMFSRSFRAIASSPFAGITAQGCERERKAKPVRHSTAMRNHLSWWL